MPTIRCLALCLICCTAPAAKVAAQTVQLPTYRQFSVGTSVLVPDRGTISLGSVSRARESSSRRGLLGGGPLTQNGGIGRELSHSGATISATIIDLQEMDRQVLAAAQRQRVGATIAGDPRRAAFAQYLTRHMGRSLPPSKPETAQVSPYRPRR